MAYFDSISSCYKTTAHTNNFSGFEFETPIENNNKIFFEIEIDGVIYKTYFYCMPSSVFNKKIGVESYIRKDYYIGLNNNIIHIHKATEEEKINLINNRKFIGSQLNNIYQIRKAAINNYRSKINWIYCDSNMIGVDNAYIQFQHDWKMQDGIHRWYVCDGNKNDIEHLFSEEQKSHIIEYGTEIHKILYLSSEYVFCSFSDVRPRVPFSGDSEYAYYRDLRQPLVIYLQHGVLHANLRYLQSAERCKVDKIVVSSYFEKETYIKNYHYKENDIIPAGMPRYDYIDKKKTAKNRILFAPSWRKYLVIKHGNKWITNYNEIMSSNYLKKFFEFLKSDALREILEKNNLYLDAKLHQNMRSLLDLFEFSSERINFVSEDVHVEDYNIFITDISSYVFDYAYLNRPVIYFMPDMDEFKSGMHSYRELELPFEKGFGKLVFTPQKAIKEIARIINKKYIPDLIYSDRMKNFFYPLDNCCEKIYQYILNNNQ